MARWVTTNRVSTLVLISTLLTALGAALFIGLLDASDHGRYTWPPLTMVYEAPTGPDSTREVHRFIYRSWSDWTDIVIESHPIESPSLGTTYTVGSYRRLSGARYEEYSPIDDKLSVDSEDVRENAIRVPNGFVQPLAPPQVISAHMPNGGAELPDFPTTATVCYRTQCNDNVVGRLFTDGRLERIVLDDPRWGIPLQSGSRFVVRELRVNAPPPKGE